MAKGCKAGCAAFRKLMRRYPGYRLVSSGSTNGHHHLVGPNGEAVRLPDGRRLTIISSPRDQDVAARELVRRLAGLGITPTT